MTYFTTTRDARLYKMKMSTQVAQIRYNIQQSLNSRQHSAKQKEFDKLGWLLSILDYVPFITQDELITCANYVGQDFENLMHSSLICICGLGSDCLCSKHYYSNSYNPGDFERILPLEEFLKGGLAYFLSHRSLTISVLNEGSSEHEPLILWYVLLGSISVMEMECHARYSYREYQTAMFYNRHRCAPRVRSCILSVLGNNLSFSVSHAHDIAAITEMIEMIIKNIGCNHYICDIDDEINAFCILLNATTAIDLYEVKRLGGQNIVDKRKHTISLFHFLLDRLIESMDNTNDYIFRMGCILERLVEHELAPNLPLPEGLNNMNQTEINDRFIDVDLREILLKYLDKVLKSCIVNDNTLSCSCLEAEKMSSVLKSLNHCNKASGNDIERKPSHEVAMNFIIKLFRINSDVLPSLSHQRLLIALVSYVNSLSPQDFTPTLKRIHHATLNAVEINIGDKAIMKELFLLIGRISKAGKVFAYDIAQRSVQIFVRFLTQKSYKFKQVFTVLEISLYYLLEKVDYFVREINEAMLLHVPSKERDVMEVHYHIACLCLSLMRICTPVKEDLKYLQKSFVTHKEAIEGNKWLTYRLALRALSEGKPLVSLTLFETLKEVISKCEYSLWYESLLLISDAFSTLLSREHSLGLTTAVTKIILAKSNISVIQSQNGKASFDFQIEVLGLYIDFLELCISARALLSELELISTLPSKLPQSTMHRWKISKCFSILQVRFISVIKRHCSRHNTLTIESLRTMSFASNFMALFFELILNDMGTLAKTMTRDLIHFESSYSHPLVILLQRLCQTVINPINRNDTIIGDLSTRIYLFRATLDIFLSTPLPFPIDFSTPMHTMVFTHVFIGPNPLDTIPSNSEMDRRDDSRSNRIIEAFESEFDLVVYGKLPFSSKRYISSIQHVLVEYRISYIGRSDEVSSKTKDESFDIVNERRLKDGAILGTERVVLPCSLDGLYDGKVRVVFDKAGYYRVFTKILYNDKRGNTWEASTIGNSGEVLICARFDA